MLIINNKVHLTGGYLLWSAKAASFWTTRRLFNRQIYHRENTDTLTCVIIPVLQANIFAHYFVTLGEYCT